MNSTGGRDSRLTKAPPPNSIRYFRRKAKFAREKLGRQIGVSGETIRKLENCDIWLDADRARELGAVLDIPYDLIGFSYAHDAYAWAVKALPVVGKITQEDEVKFAEGDRDVAGGAHFPAGCVALEVTSGKMRGWHLVYHERERNAVSRDILRRQGQCEKYLVHLVSGTTWWRRLQQSSTQDLYHLSSQHLDTIYDARVAWVSEIVGFTLSRHDLPTRAELSGINPAAPTS
ncbi:MAG: XRE family transcriptional regulator [Bradyrhizobiaceae bacterium]|jgi:transcriptional regulator with XRE-family HTH domain|nr:MAG: XRE family transcriptional regulator [Bradyrhizobiaceae bacterium]